jgi:hypothetical protein
VLDVNLTCNFSAIFTSDVLTSDIYEAHWYEHVGVHLWWYATILKRFKKHDSSAMMGELRVAKKKTFYKIYLTWQQHVACTGLHTKSIYYPITITAPIFANYCAKRDDITHRNFINISDAFWRIINISPL